MAERWVSTGKKYCEICKVWFADNRASIEFHERGDRHKANLQTKLRDVSRQREKKLQAEITMQGNLAAMEQGAYLSMKKYGDGVAEGPSLPATGVQMSYFDPRQHTDVSSMAKEMAKITDQKKNGEYRMPDGPSGPVPCKVNREAYLKAQKHQQKLAEHRYKKQAKIAEEEEGRRAAMAAAAEERKKQKFWVEAQNEEGHTYYWHMYTGQNAWQPPGPFYTATEYEIFLAQLDADKEIKHNFDLAEADQREHEHAMEQGEAPPGGYEQYYAQNDQHPDASEYLLDIPQHSGEKKKKPRRAPKRPHESSWIPENLSAGSAVPFARPEVNTRINVVEDVNTIPLPSVEPKASSSEVKEEAIEEPVEEKPEVYHFEPSEPPEPPVPVNETTGIGGWSKVVKKIESSEPAFFSPLTARYRELEEQEKKEAKEASTKKVEEKTAKIEFTEKVAAVKKVKGAVEFKKRSGGAKNARKREE